MMSLPSEAPDLVPTMRLVVVPHGRDPLHRKLPKAYKSRPDGQTLKVRLLRVGDPDECDGNKAWHGSPVIVFAPVPKGDVKEVAVRYVGAETFLKYANEDGGWFGLTGNKPDYHYLDPAATSAVCKWLREQLALPRVAAVVASLRPEAPAVTF